MKAAKLWLAACALVLSACSERSRLDELAQVDVCQLLSPQQLNAWWGSSLEAPQTLPPEGMHAGACRWSLRATAENQTGTLDLMVVTPAVAGHNPYLEKWFESSQSEVASSLGSKGTEVSKLGHRAIFYDSPGSQTAQLWVRHGKTYLVFAAHAIESRHLIDAGRAVSESIRP